MGVSPNEVIVCLYEPVDSLFTLCTNWLRVAEK